MKARIMTTIIGPVLLGVMLARSPAVSAGDLTVAAAESPGVTGFHIEAEPRQAGSLYAQIGGKDIRIADQSIAAWILEKGQRIAYSAADRAGGV